MRIKDLATRATKLLTGNAWFVVDNGTKVEKAAYSEVVKQGIEEYAGSTLAGSAQTVKSAINALNSKFVSENTGLTAASNVTLGSVYHREAGSIVLYHFIITTTADITKDTDLVTGAVTPALAANGGGFGFAFNNNSTKTTRILFLTGTGSIRCNEDIASGESLRCEVVYGK